MKFSQMKIFREFGQTANIPQAQAKKEHMIFIADIGIKQRKDGYKLTLAIGFLVSIWILKRLLQYARVSLIRARQNRMIETEYIELLPEETDADDPLDPDYPFEAETEENTLSDAEQKAIEAQIFRFEILADAYDDALQAIERETKETEKPNRLVTLASKKASLLEKLYRVEAKIDAERSKLN